MSDPHDIFVSYAHVDNEILPGEAQGWVTQFIATLEVYLRQKLGRREHYSLWRDPELAGNVPLTPEIIDTLKASQILLLILSPGYLASRWCLDELETFVKTYGVESGRIFVIERDKLGEGERPKSITDLKGYAFWVVDKHQRGVTRTLGTPATISYRADYFRQVEDVAIQLVQCIKRLRVQNVVSSGSVQGLLSPTKPVTEASQIKAAVGAVMIKATVYVAPVPDSLQLQRSDFIRALKQHHIAVLPKSNRVNYATFQQEMETDLAKSQYFIQLLDVNAYMGLVNAQYQIAKQQGLAVMQWRAPELDIDQVKDATHQMLLRGQHVMVSDLVNFQQYCLKKLFPKKTESPPEIATHAEQKIIFINVGQEDRELAEKVSQQLSAHGHFCLLPMTPDERTQPAEIRRDMEQNMYHCDALLLLYDSSPMTQVRQFLMQSWRMRAQRGRPLPTAVCISSKNQDDNLSAMAKNLRLLRCTSPFPAECVEAFLQGGEL